MSAPPDAPRPHTPTEHTLHGVLTRIRAGDDPAAHPDLFQRLQRAFGKHVPDLKRLVRRELRGGPDHRVEEIVQDTLETAWERLPGYVPAARFSSYLKQIARNHCANERRKRKDVLSEDGFLDDLALEDPTAFTRLADEERNLLVEQAAKNVLDAQEQDLVELRWVQDYPRDVVAERLGLADAEAVRVALVRCKRRLAKEIERLLAERGDDGTMLSDG